MATRIINKLYNCFDVVEGIATSIYDRELDSNFHRIETSFEHVDPPVKRATKNLESLIKAANKAGYTVHLCQSTYDKSWQAYLFTNSTTLANGGSFIHEKTPYKALRGALESVGWSDN